jgi:hypothetical protein
MQCAVGVRQDDVHRGHALVIMAANVVDVAVGLPGCRGGGQAVVITAGTVGRALVLSARELTVWRGEHVVAVPLDAAGPGEPVAEVWVHADPDTPPTGPRSASLAAVLAAGLLEPGATAGTVHLLQLASTFLPTDARPAAHEAAQARARALTARPPTDPWHHAAAALQLGRGNTAALPDPVRDVQGDARWDRMHQLHTEQTEAAGAVRGLFVGDSIMQQMALSPWWQAAVAPLSDAGTVVVNAGVGGDQLQHVLWRLQDLGATPARAAALAACRAVVVLCGTNNHDHTAAQVAAGLAAVATTIHTLCPAATITILVLGRHVRPILSVVA